jgi:hypothetical protein
MLISKLFQLFHQLSVATEKGMEGNLFREMGTIFSQALIQSHYDDLLALIFLCI